MRFHEALELRWCVFLEKVPALDILFKRWGYRILRRIFFCGATFYFIDFVFGLRRRHFGSNPLRLLPKLGASPPWRLPVTDRYIRIEHMKWFKMLSKTENTIDARRKNLPFYADADYPYQNFPKTLPDEPPGLPVVGAEYPPGLHIMHSTLNLFVHLEIDESMELYKNTELIYLEKDDFLFGVGDPDKAFHVVLTGMIKLSIHDTEYGLIDVRHVNPDEIIFSLLRLMDAFFEDSKWCKPANAIAGEKSVVLGVPYSAVRSYFDRHPEMNVPFMRRCISNIRTVYFSGFQELTGLEQQLLHPRFSIPDQEEDHVWDSQEEDEEDEDTKSIVLDIPKARQALIATGIHLTDEQFSKCTVGVIPGGTIVTRVGRMCKSVLFVVDGFIEVGVDDQDTTIKSVRQRDKYFAEISTHFRPLYKVPKGEFYGGWGVLTDSANSFTSRIRPGKKALVIEISRKALEEMWVEDPHILYYFSKGLINRFNELCRQIDICLGWKQFPPGKRVYREGDPQLSIFLITHGRLRFRVRDSYSRTKKFESVDSNKTGCYNPGVWFGFVEGVAATEEMQKTVIADRFSEVVYFPQMLMKLLIFRFPTIFTKMSDYLANKLHREYDYEIVGPFHGDERVEDFVSAPEYVVKTKQSTVEILAVFPLGPTIPVELYCMDLIRHYRSKSRFRTHRHFKEYINFDFNRETDFELKRWYHDTIEDREYDDVSLYVIAANYDKMDLWNTMLARQADFVHFVGDYSTYKDIPLYETEIVKESWKATKDYVFLHRARYVLSDKAVFKGRQSPKYHLIAPKPKNSILWLEQRPWLDAHHHVRFPESAFKYAETKNQKYLDEYNNRQRLVGVNKHSDMGRLGRRLSKECTGVVLGGGGAKGACHIGVLEYIQEMDIPIDYICGVSIGSFVGALLSHYEQQLEPVYDKLSYLLNELRQPLKYIRDLTFPYTSLLRGQSFNEFVKAAFDDTRIEDLWTPFFPVTTDITGNRSRIHKSGKLWFYVRASMTLTMVFPPLVDPQDNHLIMDGGYSEILPGDRLRQVGCAYILAIDITDENGIPTFEIGYECSGFFAFVQNLMPTLWPSIPSQFTFWEQLNFVAATKYIEMLKRMDNRVIYIRPMIELYNGKDFHKMEEMRYMGYYSARKKFAGYHPCLSLAAVWTIFSSYRHSTRKLYIQDDK